MVALLRCRLQRFLAHWASASLSRTAGNSAPPCSNAAGEALTTACGGNIVRAEVNRNKRSPLCGVAPIEVAESKLCLAIAVTRSYLADGCSMGLVTHSFVVDKSSSPGGSSLAKNRRFQGSRPANTGPAASKMNRRIPFWSVIIQRNDSSVKNARRTGLFPSAF